MSHRNYSSHDDGRRHTDPSSSRFNSLSRYHPRGGGRGMNRPVQIRRPTDAHDLRSITVSLDGNLLHDRSQPRAPMSRGRFEHRDARPRPGPRPIPQETQARWWRVSIPQVGLNNKERMMSTLRAHCARQFQPYHYFIDRESNMGVFFVNSQQDADMLRRANRQVEVQNLGMLSIMVSQASCPAPFLDEDLRKYFKDFICQHRFNPQTFQLNLSNLADDEELSSLGIFPQLNKSAFIQVVIDIINKDLSTTRQLDLGSNNISNLNDFRNLRLNTLEQLSLASNQLRSVEELIHLKHLPHLYHLHLKDNPMTSPNNRRNGSREDLISCFEQPTTLYRTLSSAIRLKIPQLKRIDDADLPAQIGFAIDQEIVSLPPSNPHCVPQDLHKFLGEFIDIYYRFFDAVRRDDLHGCYHDSCLFSVCIAPTDRSIVPTKPYKYGPLLYDSRNLKQIFDDNKRVRLLLHGKSAVLDFLRVKFPPTQHDDKSFHVDVISTANNRVTISVHGLYREVDTGANGPVRSFQRTFTYVQTPTGVLIVADHVTIANATEAQVANMTRGPPPPPTTTASASVQVMDSHSDQQPMIARFSTESGMNLAFSERCLSENKWNYLEAAKNFQDLKSKNLIPAEAFK